MLGSKTAKSKLVAEGLRLVCLHLTKYYSHIGSPTCFCLVSIRRK